MEKCRCGKDVETNRKRCKCCLDRERISASKKREYRRQNNLCIECGQLAEIGYVRCITHLNREKKQTLKYKEIGKCLGCGKDSMNDRTCCSLCLEEKRKKSDALRKHRKNNDLCVDCGKNKSVSGVCCESCYLKRTARRYFNDVSKSEELKVLCDKQNATCPYSGRKLFVGSDSTELDHRICRSAGGEEKIENMQWVDSAVNRMKWTMTEEEFLGLVKEIYLHRFGTSI